MNMLPVHVRWETMLQRHEDGESPANLSKRYEISKSAVRKALKSAREEREKHNGPDS